MLKRYLFTSSLVFACLFSNAQFDTAFAKANIHRCADSLVYGFKTKDSEIFTRYSYPALIGSMGGKDEFINYISQMFLQVPDSAWKKYETGNILQVIKTDGDLQTLIELNSVLEWQGNRITTTSYLVGECWDGGLFWTFFDSQNDVSIAKLIKPDLSEQLIIPKKNVKVEPL
jgi:hypothetical protein